MCIGNLCDRGIIRFCLSLETGINHMFYTCFLRCFNNMLMLLPPCMNVVTGDKVKTVDSPESFHQ